MSTSSKSIKRAVGHGLEIPRERINAEDFYRLTAKSADGCWIWQHAPKGNGYGLYRIYIDGRQRGFGAHRVSYTLSVGVIPDGMEVDHLCRNRICVNPDHLEAVTPQVNTARSNGVTARAARQWLDGKCGNGHDLATVGVHKQGPGWTCAQCGRDRVARYKLRKQAANASRAAA